MDTTLCPEMYIDFHTHREAGREGVKPIRNCLLKPGCLADVKIPGCGIFSAGIHPWDAEGWGAEDLKIVQELLGNPNVVFIGETGFDKNCGVSWEKQQLLFRKQLEMAECYAKPVILHNVRSTAELLKELSSYPRVPAWIHHGFRGKPEQAELLLKKGFYLSFGVYFNPEALQVCPLERLLLETDEGKEKIEEVYKRAASVLGRTVIELEAQMEKNLIRLLKK